VSMFHKKRKPCIVIVGCGHFGYPIVQFLLEQDVKLTVIDTNPDAFARIPLSLNGLMITGDGTDPDTLDAAGIISADAVIAATNDDAANIMIAQMVKQKYHIETVIARLYDTSKEKTYRDLGVQVISPVMLFTNACFQILNTAVNEV